MSINRIYTAKLFRCLLSDYTIQNLTSMRFPADNSWVVLSPIEQRIKEKIEKVGKPLREWDINIYRGVLTGYNEAFVIDGKTKDELVAKSPKNAEIIRPILRGRDIKRYRADFADQWLINTHNGTKNTPPVNIDNYPDIKEHLDRYYPALEQRQDKGITPYHLRSCIYTEDFSKQKIVWGNLCLSAQYAMVDDEIFVNAPSTMIVPGSKYLLGLLNSKLSDFYIRQLGVTRNGGYFEYKPMFISQLPVPVLCNDEHLEIASLVGEIMKGTDNDNTRILESEINNCIYNLYGLTDDEMLFIDTL